LRAQQRWTCAAILIATFAKTISAQQVQAAVSLTGGSATDVVGVTSRAVTLVPSVTIAPDPRVAFLLSANATRFDNQQWAGGVGATTALRAPLGRFAALTLNATGNATKTSYDFSYYTASALPALEGDVGAVSAYIGGRAGLASTSFTKTTQTTPSGGLFGGGTPFETHSLVTASRSMYGAVFGANVRIPGSGGENAIVGVREEHSTIDTVPTVDRSASLTVMSGRLTLGGTLGLRTEPGMQTTFGNGALSIAVSPAMSVDLNAGSYAADHLVGTPAGKYVNLGLSLRTGAGGNATPKQPSPEGAPKALAGFTRLAISADRAQRVDVEGDFTNWKPIATHRTPNGVWYVDLRIPAGQYRYAFRVDGNEWRLPEGVAVVDDDFGGKTAWLVVSAPSMANHQEE
jgi:hypothetical protein